MKSLRKYITSSTGFTFLVVAATGLYFKLFTKTKMLEEIHGWVGILMLAFALLHLYQNWGSFQNHLKDKTTWLTLVPILIIIGIFSFSGTGPSNKMGPKEVMVNLMSSRLITVSEVFKQNPDEVLIKMRDAGLTINSGEQKIDEIAKLNNKKPDEILIFFKK